MKIEKEKVTCKWTAWFMQHQTVHLWPMVEFKSFQRKDGKKNHNSQYIPKTVVSQKTEKDNKTFWGWMHILCIYSVQFIYKECKIEL